MNNIVGQKNLLDILDKQIENGFPRFSIIVGDIGSGRKTISKYIAEKLNLSYVECDTKIETVREVIASSYTYKTKSLYVFANCDNMHINAKNALLKITEEPPENAYFIMTVQDKNQILNTLISRASVFLIEPYNVEDINEFILMQNISDETERDILLNICQNPSDINKVISYGVSEFYEYCERVLDNIGLVEGSNAFKITNKLQVKEDGWDIKLFLNTISNIALERIKQTFYQPYVDVIKICSKYNQELSRGYNKRFLIDAWVLSMREVLY